MSGALICLGRSLAPGDAQRLQAEIARCRRERDVAEAALRAGHPDVQGLCRALVDWSAELRLLQASQGLATAAPRLAHVRAGGDRLACRPTLP
jgi:hypothetical protein